MLVILSGKWRCFSRIVWPRSLVESLLRQSLPLPKGNRRESIFSPVSCEDRTVPVKAGPRFKDENGKALRRLLGFTGSEIALAGRMVRAPWFQAPAPRFVRRPCRACREAAGQQWLPRGRGRRRRPSPGRTRC